MLSREALTRREFLAGAAAVGATVMLPGELAAVERKKTFALLHTNDMHASFIGMGPASDYTPFTLNDDTTRGGYARLAGLIAKRKEARQGQGPVLVLDSGDYSMGTAFSASTRETGGELHLMGLMGYDATTFGNHEFDLGPAGLRKPVAAAVKVGRIPALLAANTSAPDSFRATAKADIGFSANGMMRAGLLCGKTGVQTVYDVFAVAPLGAGVVDPTPGSIFTRHLGSPWCAEGYHWLMAIAAVGSLFPKSIFPCLAFKELHRDLAQPEQA
jgi:5'-nucleotidase